MTLLFIFLIALIFGMYTYMRQVNGELVISPIIGVMFGILYDADEQEDFTYYTFQILILNVSFNYLWQK